MIRVLCFLLISLLACSVAGQTTDKNMLRPAEITDSMFQIQPEWFFDHAVDTAPNVWEFLPDPPEKRDTLYWQWTGPKGEQVPCPDGKFGCLALHYGQGWKRIPGRWNVDTVTVVDTVVARRVPQYVESEYKAGDSICVYPMHEIVYYNFVERDSVVYTKKRVVFLPEFTDEEMDTIAAPLR